MPTLTQGLSRGPLTDVIQASLKSACALGMPSLETGDSSATMWTSGTKTSHLSSDPCVNQLTHQLNGAIWRPWVRRRIIHLSPVELIDPHNHEQIKWCVLSHYILGDLLHKQQVTDTLFFHLILCSVSLWWSLFWRHSWSDFTMYYCALEPTQLALISVAKVPSCLQIGMIVHGTLSIQRLVIHTHTYVHAGKCMLTNASKFEREREREKEETLLWNLPAWKQ
jgi:hypothetical protein